MAKNYMVEVAKMLGVEFGELFEVTERGVTYKHYLKPNGVYRVYSDDQLGKEVLPYVLTGILTGEYEFKKLPWRPKKGDEYYYPGEGFNNVCRALWGNTVFGFAYKEAGLIFKTYEECEAALPALRKKYLGGDDNV